MARRGDGARKHMRKNTHTCTHARAEETPSSDWWVSYGRRLVNQAYLQVSTNLLLMTKAQLRTLLVQALTMTLTLTLTLTHNSGLGSAPGRHHDTEPKARRASVSPIPLRPWPGGEGRSCRVTPPLHGRSMLPPSVERNVAIQPLSLSDPMTLSPSDPRNL